MKSLILIFFVFWVGVINIFAQQTLGNVALSKENLKNVVLLEDEDIKVFYEGATKKVNTEKLASPVKGYRVQIYNGNDRSKASEIKMSFMKKYAGIRSYIVFNNPQYRVRVGDFVTREEAELFQEKIGSEFGATMILPDNINYSNKKTSNNP